MAVGKWREKRTLKYSPQACELLDKIDNDKIDIEKLEKYMTETEFIVGSNQVLRFLLTGQV